MLLTGFLSGVSAWAFLALPPYIACAVAAAGVGRVKTSTVRRWGLAFCGLTLALFTLVVISDAPVIDVHLFLTDGVRALLHGTNPYDITFPNIYTRQKADAFYGPGVVEDGRITYGFPYPPLLLFTAVPGYLMGDVRLSAALALAGLGAVLMWRSTTPTARTAAVLLLCSPGVPYVVPNSWVEPVIVATLGLALLAITRGRFATAAILLGLLMVSKQYFIVLTPCLWLLRPYATRGRVLTLAASAALGVVPFLAWNPSAFWRSVVEFQFVQPYRPDSLSILVWTVNHASGPVPKSLGVLSLAAGFLTACVLAVRLSPGRTSFAVAISVALVVTVILSKQAFLNYYYLASSALLLAAWCRATPPGSADGAQRAADE